MFKTGQEILTNGTRLKSSSSLYVLSGIKEEVKELEAREQLLIPNHAC